MEETHSESFQIPKPTFSGAYGALFPEKIANFSSRPDLASDNTVETLFTSDSARSAFP